MEGHLIKNDIGRWEITTEDGREFQLTSGSVCEVLVGKHWVRTSVESSNGSYYATTPGVLLMKGIPARTIEGSR